MGSRGSGPRFTIGEFSKITGLTVKTLRFYHEQGLLRPAFVDPRTDYRYYDPGQVEAARAITFLRSLEFPVAEIRELLETAGDEGLLDANAKVTVVSLARALSRAEMVSAKTVRAVVAGARFCAAREERNRAKTKNVVRIFMLSSGGAQRWW